MKARHMRITMTAFVTYIGWAVILYFGYRLCWLVIMNPTMRLRRTIKKLNRLSPQRDVALSRAKNTINLPTILDPILAEAKEKVIDSCGKEMKDTGLEEISRIHKFTFGRADLAGNVSIPEANALKEEMVHLTWSYPRAWRHPDARSALCDVHYVLDRAVDDAIGPRSARLNRRVNKLAVLKNLLIHEVERRQAGVS